MKHIKFLFIVLSLFVMQGNQIMYAAKAKKPVPAKPVPAKPAAAKPAAGRSQTASYLSTLGKTRQEAYAKIKKALTAPPVVDGKPMYKLPPVHIVPEAFDSFVDQAIETERKHPGYFAFYQGSQKEGFLTHLLRTYINQIENGWTRNDFIIVRSPEAYYKKTAKTAADYIDQNLPYILQQFIPTSSSGIDPHCIFGHHVSCGHFDGMTDWSPSGSSTVYDWRDQLISTSPSFISGVDDTSQVLRELYDEDYAAWESAFYYFAAGLSWKNVRSLYTIMVGDLKKYSPSLFANKPIDIQIRKYIAIKFTRIVDLLFPYPHQKLDATQDLHSKAGMMLQFLIPANVVDDVAYLSWQNGPLWQRKINGFDGGWDNTIGAYTKISPMLERMQTNPQGLGQAIHLFQTRLIFKDPKYFNDPKSPIKINLIHSLQPSLFTSIEDSLRAIARVVVEYKQAGKKEATWFEQTDIANFIKSEEANLTALLGSKSETDQMEAMNILYYFAATGVDVQRAKQMANKYKNSGNAELKTLSMDILGLE